MAVNAFAPSGNSLTISVGTESVTETITTGTNRFANAGPNPVYIEFGSSVSTVTGLLLQAGSVEYLSTTGTEASLIAANGPQNSSVNITPGS